MMQTVGFGRWSLAFDAESTKQAYATIGSGSPEACGCEPCRNFAAQRSQIYPARVLELFESLGIDPGREAEIYHMAKTGTSDHLYGGWFHFVGSIQDGRDGVKQVAENRWQPDLEAISDRFSIGFSSRTELVPKAFQGLSVVQVEFEAKLPWILKTGEPER